MLFSLVKKKENTQTLQLSLTWTTGERWYDVAFRVASEQVLEAIDSGKTCASEYFEAVQHGQQLVLGETSSAPGFVCGIANAVVDEDKPVPGTCCLDAPYELSDADWGLSVSMV